MRVLQFSKGSEMGGLATFAAAEYNLLKNHIEIIPATFESSIRLETPSQRYNAFFAFRQLKTKKDAIKAQIDAFKPDILHLHSLLPFITPEIMNYAHQQDIKMVFTLHDFKLLYHDGMVYDADRKKRFFHDLVHPRYWKHGSLFLTTFYSVLLSFYRKRGLYNLVDRFIAPSRFLYNYFLDVQFSREQLTYIPHFLSDFSRNLAAPDEGDGESYFLILGRISPEKDIPRVVHQWIDQKIEYPLKIVGSGVQYEEVKALVENQPHITLEGEVAWEDGLQYLANMYALISPSNCYESFGLNVLESFIAGKPVICTKKAGRNELAQDRVNALFYDGNDGRALKQKVIQLATNNEMRQRLGNNARKHYLQQFNPRRYLEKILELYRQVLND